MTIRHTVNATTQSATPKPEATNNYDAAPVSQSAQLTEAQADLAMHHVTRQLAAARHAPTRLDAARLDAPRPNVAHTNTAQQPADESNPTFQTVGGSWRVRDADGALRFYRDGEDTANTRRFDQEYFRSVDGAYVRLSARGALADLPQNRGKWKPTDVSDFEWQGWERVLADRVPADYTTEGRAVTFRDPRNAQNPVNVLKRYVVQHDLLPGVWDEAKAEGALRRALAAGVKVEAAEVGREADGAARYEVRMDAESLRKLRAELARYRSEAGREQAGGAEGQREATRMVTDMGRVMWNSAVNIAEGTINGGVDAALHGGQPGRIYNPAEPQAVDFSGAKSPY